MTPRRLRVLLIEDNLSDARLVHFLLEHKPVTLIHADKLATGLEYCAEEEIHLVLLDLSLPDSTGTETYQRFCIAQPEIPVIILTGLSDEETALQLVHEGAQDYLLKGKIESDWQEYYGSSPNLTEDIVLNWVWTNGGVDKQLVEDSVTQELNSIINPVLVKNPLPWI